MERMAQDDDLQTHNENGVNDDKTNNYTKTHDSSATQKINESASKEPHGSNQYRTEEKIDEELENSHVDAMNRKHSTIYSFHDSDSEMGDFGLDIERLDQGPNLDESMADSWDWTFHDETVSDLDVVNRAPLSARASKVKAMNFHEDKKEDISFHQEDISPRPSTLYKGHACAGPAHLRKENTPRQEHRLHSGDTLQKEATFSQDITVHKQKSVNFITKSACNSPNSTKRRKGGADGNRRTWLQEEPLQFQQPRESVQDKNSTTSRDPRCRKRFQTHQADTDKENIDAAAIVQDVVYFEDPKSFKIRKAKLRYLSDPSATGSRSGKNKGRKVIKSKVTSNNSVLNMYSDSTAKEAEKRNLRVATKLDQVELKFAMSGRMFDQQASVVFKSTENQRTVSSTVSSSLSKSESFPLPVFRKKNDPLLQRRRSLNDLISKKSLAWAKSRGRTMSKLDLLVNIAAKEAVKRHVGDVQSSGAISRKIGIKRFRHMARMVVIMLKAFGHRRVKQEENNYNFLSWTVVYDEVLGISRLNYDSGALTFDPLVYKANKESTLTQEIKDILRLPSEQRTEANIHAVMVSFRNVIPSFSEFPKRIQQSMIKVCMYEKFEAGCVIIRQGHRAENFYFIISGCAVVTQVDSGAKHVHTTNVLGKGNSFGELAFLHMSKRSATVTCRDDVELICIEREDFIDIFMRPHGAKEPDHIAFLRNVDLLQGWPVAEIPHANPKICAFTYVRRGVILCHDSDKSDWIIVIFSGSCKILKALEEGPRVRPGRKPGTCDADRISPIPNSSSFSPKAHTTTTTNSNESGHKKSGTTDRTQRSGIKNGRIRRQGRLGLSFVSPHVSSDSLDEKQEQDVTLSQIQHVAEINSICNRKHAVPSVIADSQKLPENHARKVPYEDHQSQSADSLFRPKRQSYGYQAPALPQLVEPPPDMVRSQEKNLGRRIFIEITRLEAGDVFGLEHVVLQGLRDVASCSLVSEGAEVILISKAFFTKHLTEDAQKRMRQTIRPLPSEKMLQKKLHMQKSWDIFKSQTLAQHTSTRNRL